MDIDDALAPGESRAMNPGGKSAALGRGLPDKDFDALVAEAYEMVPEKFREKAKDAALVIEAEPASGNALGAYQAPPDTITVFRKPILEYAAAEVGATFDWGPPTEPMKRRIRDIIRNTIWHEIAKHFSMDEYEAEEPEA